MSDDEATPEQMLNIANYFVRSSPPGEVDKVVEYLKKLIDPSVLT